MNEAEQQVRRLDALNEQEATRFLTELTTKLSAEKEYELRHEDYVMEIPQSGECVWGKGNPIPIRVAKEMANPPRHRGPLSVDRRATGSRHHKANLTCAWWAVARTGHNAEQIEFLE